MPGSGQRKQLMYDLTSRIVDERTIPLNLVIVSNWARTGWNVIKPHILIDATATRDVTVWQQLRGRVIRARRTWTNDCFRLLAILTGDHRLESDTQLTEEHLGNDPNHHHLDDNLHPLLHQVAPPKLKKAIEERGIDQLDLKDRQALAISLMEKRNKVTNIYELVKAYGSGSQVTYHRTEKVWRRRESIADKHHRESAVNPINGHKSPGVEHAPLIYSADPRSDLPSELQVQLEKLLHQSDDVVVRGWITTAAVGADG